MLLAGKNIYKPEKKVIFFIGIPGMDKTIAMA